MTESHDEIDELVDWQLSQRKDIPCICEICRRRREHEESENQK